MSIFRVTFRVLIFLPQKSYLMTNMICNRYRVTAKGISAEGEILIRIYPPAYWDLLQIRRNKTLYVEESTSVMISRDILEVGMRFLIGFHLFISNN